MSHDYIINFTSESPVQQNQTRSSFTIKPYTTDGNTSPTSEVLEPTSVIANTPLLFFGRFSPNYGEKMQENLLHICENFRGPTPPVNPISGQLWFDSQYNQLKVRDYSNTSWIGVVTSNGSSVMAAHLKMNGYRVQNVGTPLVGTDAVTKNYVDTYFQNQAYGSKVISKALYHNATSETTIQTPQYIGQSNMLFIHVNGLKKYKDVTPQHKVTFSNRLTPTTSTGVLSTSTYSCSIVINGVTTSINVAGAYIPTFGDVINVLNTNLSNGKSVLEPNGIVVYSTESVVAGVSVQITIGTLFQSLTGYVGTETGQVGVVNDYKENAVPGQIGTSVEFHNPITGYVESVGQLNV